MYFATGFLLFFVLDILIFTRFWLFGMWPVGLLIAALGLFTAVLLARNCDLFPSRREKRLLRVWVGFTFLIALEPLVAMFVFRMRDKIRIIDRDYFALLHRVNVGVLILALSLFFSTLLSMPRRNPVFRWLLFVAASVALTYAVDGFWRPMPMLAHRYSGVFDLPMLFGWLMVVHTFILERFGFGR